MNEEGTNGKMSTKGAQVEVEPKTPANREVGSTKCSKHRDEDLKRFCTKCKLPVCIDCMSEDPHSSHTDKISKIDKVYTSVENGVREVYRKANQFNLDKIKPKLEDIDKNRQMSRSAADITIQEIVERQKEIKRQIDIATEKLLDKVEKVQQNYEEELKKTENAILDIRTGAVDICKTAGNVLQTGSKLDVMVAYSKLQEQYTDIPFLPSVPNFMRARFIENPIETRKIEKLIGEVQTPTTRQMSIDGDLVVNGFVVLSNDPVDALVPLNDQLWIHKDGGTTIQLVSVHKMEVAMEVYTEGVIDDMARTKSGDIIMTSSADQCIQRMEGITGELFKFGDKNTTLTPKGLCVTGSKNERVVVCMVEADDSQGFLQIYDVYGKKKKTIKFDTEGKRLFTNPKKVTVNQRGHYCVLDTNRIVIVHKDGVHLLNTYTGIRQESCFQPEHIICNNKGNLVVVDSADRFHLLDPSGQLLYLISPSDKNLSDIYSLAKGFDDGTDTILIGCENGVVVASLCLDQD